MSTARLPVMHILTRYGGVAVRSSAAAGHCPACVTSATRWNVTRRPVNHRVPPPAKDLAVLGHDRGPSRWRIPAAAGVPRRCSQERSGRPESEQGPSMYEMEGPCPASPRWPASCPALPAPRAARRGQVPARRTGLPAPPTFPGSPPGGARFRTVKTLLLPQRAPRKALRPAISCFSALHEGIHRKQAVIRISQRLSTGLFTACPQATGWKPENT